MSNKCQEFVSITSCLRVKTMVCWHEIFDRNENSVSCLPVTSQSRDSDTSDIQMNTLMKLIVFYLSSIKAPSGETVGTQQIECRKRRNKY